MPVFGSVIVILYVYMYIDSKVYCNYNYLKTLYVQICITITKYTLIIITKKYFTYRQF